MVLDMLSTFVDAMPTLDEEDDEALEGSSQDTSGGCYAVRHACVGVLKRRLKAASRVQQAHVLQHPFVLHACTATVAVAV